MFHQKIFWFCATNMAEMSWRLVRKYLASDAKKHCRKMLWHPVENIQWLLTDVPTQSRLRLSSPLVRVEHHHHLSTSGHESHLMWMRYGTCCTISTWCAWHVQMCTCGLRKCKMPASPPGDWAVLRGRRSFLQSTRNLTSPFKSRHSLSR